MSPFGIRPTDRVALFIDGHSFYHTTRNLGYDVDYKALRAHFDEKSQLYRAMYFTAIPDGETPIVKLVGWLEYNRYRTFSKQARDFGDPTRRRSSMNTEIAVEMLEAAPFADHYILFSGEGDLTYPVDAVQRKGARVTVVSTTQFDPIPISNELRRSCDHFVDLADEKIKAVMFKRDVSPREREPVMATGGGAYSMGARLTRL